MAQKIGRMCIYLEVDDQVSLIVGVSDFTKNTILNTIECLDEKVRAVKMPDLKFEELPIKKEAVES